MTLIELHDIQDGKPVVINFEYVEMIAEKEGGGTIIVGPGESEPMAIVKESIAEIAQLVVITRIL